jgi:iron complex outermembrane receptor protein
MLYRWLTTMFVFAVVAPVFGQEAADEEKSQDEPLVFEEQVVVTASRIEQELVNAPATLTLITSETIQNSPAVNIGDLLRSVPGVNISQVSARDINITARGSTSTLSTSQLALVDGRSIYLDFFGLVMWDLVPQNLDEIKQIEVLRGPASAVWGANAMNGVVNVITKSPRELAAEGGTSFNIGVGTFGRARPGGTDLSRGSLFYANGSQAVAIDDHWSYKLSAGYYGQDALARPAGTIDNAFNTPYPAYPNSGTAQPKFDVRVDYDYANGGTMSFSGGMARTEGAVHSGLGPFDVDRGTRMSYASVRYDKSGRHIGFFTNILDGIGANLLTVGVTGQPLPLNFKTKTFDVDYSDVYLAGERNVLTYGGNFRRNTFNISLAPIGKDRNEGGAFIQDEIFISDHLRWVIGGRVDKFSSIDNAVFSPRTTFMVKPSPAQTIRVSFNRAFRAPSFINNNLGTTILNQVNLSAIHPFLSNFIFPLGSVGNPNLKQETMTAIELGYTGILANRTTVNASVYWNRTDDGIFFTQVGSYSAANPPVTWPSYLPGLPFPLSALPTSFLLNFIPAPGLPSLFTYQNLGTVKDKGIELSVDSVVNEHVNLFANYSYQFTPVVEGFSLSEVNLPPKNRINAGINFSYNRYLGNIAINYTDSAYWQDVLDARFHGSTKSYTLINIGFGVRWADGRYITSLKASNLGATGDNAIQQHIFGDLIQTQVVGELRVKF